MDRLGLGWDTVHALNPRLVYLAMKGSCPVPYEHRPSLDELAQFMTGLAYMTGPPGQPLRAGASVVDIMGGVMGVIGVLAALRQRDRDGIGRKVTSSLFESSAFLVAQHMAGEAATGTATAADAGAPRRLGNLTRHSPPGTGRSCSSASHPTTTGAPSARNSNDPSLFADPRFTTNADRVTNRPALREYIAAIALDYDIATLERMMDEANIPFSPVRTPSDLFDDPQMNAHGRMLPIRMPGATWRSCRPRRSVSMTKRPALRRQPPAAGEHTEEVLHALGYTPEQIAALRAGGAVS